MYCKLTKDCIKVEKLFQISDLIDPAKINNFFHIVTANGLFFGLIFNFNRATFAGGRKDGETGRVGDRASGRLGDWETERRGDGETGLAEPVPEEPKGARGRGGEGATATHKTLSYYTLNLRYLGRRGLGKN